MSAKSDKGIEIYKKNVLLVHNRKYHLLWNNAVCLQLEH